MPLEEECKSFPHFAGPKTPTLTTLADSPPEEARSHLPMNNNFQKLSGVSPTNFNVGVGTVDCDTTRSYNKSQTNEYRTSFGNISNSSNLEIVSGFKTNKLINGKSLSP